jgi:dienelactone hydrolase
MEATMRLEDLDVEVNRVPGTSHGFAEPDGETYDASAFERTWDRTLRFLEEKLAP